MAKTTNVKAPVSAQAVVNEAVRVAERGRVETHTGWLVRLITDAATSPTGKGRTPPALTAYRADLERLAPVQAALTAARARRPWAPVDQVIAQAPYDVDAVVLAADVQAHAMEQVRALDRAIERWAPTLSAPEPVTHEQWAVAVYAANTVVATGDVPDGLAAVTVRYLAAEWDRWANQDLRLATQVAQDDHAAQVRSARTCVTI